MGNQIVDAGAVCRSGRPACIGDHGANAYLFTGGMADRAGDRRGSSEPCAHPATNLAGATSLIELAALYRRMALVISTDTGPMHIAAAVDTPVVALFGPTADSGAPALTVKLHRVVAPDLDLSSHASSARATIAGACNPYPWKMSWTHVRRLLL